MILALVACVFALAQCSLESDGSNSNNIQVILPTAEPEPEIELKVYISGAVKAPGVYTVQEGDRLADVLEASGGAADDADLESVNLAVRVEDEDHWHIPKVGEETNKSVSSAPLQDGGGESGKIDINTANVEKLKTLPGIGDVKAQSIVSFRELNGPFESVDDLIEIRGIGTATLESIRDLVEVR